MAKIEDYKAYWMELAAKAGVPQDKAQAMADVMGDEAVAKALKQGFKAIPDYSYDLDQVRDRTKAEATAEAKAFYDNWYKTTGEPAYLEHQRIADEYKRYKETYGDLDGGGNGNGNRNAPSYTKEDILKEVESRLAARDAAVVNLTKQSWRYPLRHYKQFGEEIDPDALEKFAADNKFSNLDEAYLAFIRPKMEAKAQVEMEAKLKAAKEEGAREALSRHKIPTDSKPREYVNPLNPANVVPKDADPDQFSRDEFLKAWDNPKT
jgi:hypothetical protein